MRSKFISLDEAAYLIKDNSTIWVSGCGGGINDPDILLSAIEQRFIETGKPSSLIVYHSAGIGNKKGGGVDRFAHEGMVRKVVGSHWTWSKNLQKMAAENKIEAYVMPQGVMTQLTRDIAAHRPGLITKTGLGTFIDPRIEGGAVNSISRDKVASVLVLDGEEYLFYKSIKIDVAIFRAARADSEGNVSFTGEGLISEALSEAQAAYNNKGLVLVQVKERVSYRFAPNDVTIPSQLITGIVVCPKQQFSYSIVKDDRLCGIDNFRVDLPESFDGTIAKSIIARNALNYINDGDVVNLGFGLPSIIGIFARMDRRLSHVTFTLEQGIIGGIPSSGENFGVSYYPDAYVAEPNQFDWYDGGGIDTAILSFAQFDKYGNVNVSKFMGLVNGVGGFINISQNAKKVIFVGTFTTSGLEVLDNGGYLQIKQEGGIRKIIDSVEQISFSADQALRRGQEIYYITERAIFKLENDGIHLIEVTKGIDLDKDIIPNMGFLPKFS